MWKKLVKSNTSHCIKCLVISFNIISVVVGGILMMLGTTMRTFHEKFFSFVKESYLSVPNGVTAFGAIIFFVAICGFFGTIWYHYPSLAVFTSLLMLILITEIGVAVTGYILRVKAADAVTKSMINSMRFYHNESYHIWDFTQRELDCCGTYESNDWEHIFHNDSLPMSCCTIEPATVGLKTCDQSTTDKPEGCAIKILSIIKLHSLKLCAAVIGIIISQIFAIVLSICLARNVKSDYLNVNV